MPNYEVGESVIFHIDRCSDAIGFKSYYGVEDDVVPAMVKCVDALGNYQISAKIKNGFAIWWVGPEAITPVEVLN